MNRPLFVFALIFALMLAGVASVNGAEIALAIPLLAYLGASVLERPGAPQLRVERTLTRINAATDSGAHAAAPAAAQTGGTQVAVTLRVTNDGAALRDVMIEDNLEPGLLLAEGDTRVLTSLNTGESVELRYTAYGQRGEHLFRSATIEAADRFGLITRRERFAAPGTLLVQPEPQRLRSIEIRPPRTRGFAGQIPARQGGAGVDFFNLREYQPGDRLRWINWRATARSDARNGRQLYSNVYEQRRLADIGIILDARQQTDLRSDTSTLFEHSVTIAAALAETFLADGNRVGLLVYGGSLASIFPGYGHVQRARILRALGRASTGQHFVFENLKNLPTRFFAAGSQIAFIGPCNGEDVPTLIRLRAHAYSVMVASPNPIAFEAAQLSGAVMSHPRTALALRIAQAERNLHFHTLRRSGVQVVDWDVSRPLDAVMHEALARQPVQRITMMRG